MRVDQDVTFGSKLADALERKTGDPAPSDDGLPVWIWIALAGLLMAAAGITVAYVRLRHALTKIGPPVIPRV